MKTAMGLEKAKVWISENLGTKMTTRLFRGLALGALLVAATGVYFSINQGEANLGEVGSPSARERIGCYPDEEYNVRPCVSDIGWDPAAVSSLVSEQIGCYPDEEYNARPCVSDFGRDPAAVSSLVSEEGEVAATVIYRYDRSLDDEFMSDAPFFHALNQDKVGSRPSINGITCYPEDDC